jgi:lia operon protein LiaF
VISLGIIFLLVNLDVTDITAGRVWSIIWPLLLVALGLSLLKLPGRLLFGDRSWHRHGEGSRHEGKLTGEIHMGGPGWRLEDKVIQLAAGQVHLDLTHAQVPEGETKLSVHGGVGEVEVRMPTGVGIAASASTNLGEINLLGLRSEGVSRHLEYTSDDYDQLAKGIRLDISLAVGQITVTRGA